MGALGILRIKRGKQWIIGTAQCWRSASSLLTVESTKPAVTVEQQILNSLVSIGKQHHALALFEIMSDTVCEKLDQEYIEGRVCGGLEKDIYHIQLIWHLHVGLESSFSLEDQNVLKS